jgi:hypothetical protein
MVRGGVVASAGWCAPATVLYDAVTFVEPEVWPAGLKDADIRWLAEMLWVAEIDLPATHYLDLPAMSISRGGIRFPTAEEVGDDDR